MSTISWKAEIDPKLVADQLELGLGVNLDVYTISDIGPSTRIGESAGAESSVRERRQTLPDANRDTVTLRR
jgi:hypothetical protein